MHPTGRNHSGINNTQPHPAAVRLRGNIIKWPNIMKKSLLFILFVWNVVPSWASSFIIDNQTQHSQTKMTIQWAHSVKEIEDQKRSGQGIQSFKTLPFESQSLNSERGKATIIIPTKAEYFRILVWATHKNTPDFLTNWVDVVPNKTYTLETGHLVPVALMVGMGC